MGVALVMSAMAAPSYGATKVLLTSFEPFGGEIDNVSLEMVEHFKKNWEAQGAAYLDHDIELKTAVLPVVFGGNPQYPGAEDVLKAAVDSFHPDLVISFGQIEGETDFRIEKQAFNLDDGPFADNQGVVRHMQPIIPGGPTTAATTLPVEGLVEALHTAQYPVKTSQSAGRYLCNHVFYHLMALQKTHPTIRMAGFIHVPGMPLSGPRQPQDYKNRGLWGAGAIKSALDSILTHW